MVYRPDIDGLRAIAVVCVVFFHAFPKILPGGFIGVDIFFVISGYLISGVIISALAQGKFTFRHFYSRRVLRIFPALTVVLAACAVGGWFLLLPEEIVPLGKHILGGATFVSNILLYKEVGYFDAASHAKPLLNLWSLGIEEQFYIAFPLIVWLCWRYLPRLFFIFAMLCLLSFIDNMALYRAHPSADFYLPLSRFWELLAGATLQAASRPACSHMQIPRRIAPILSALDMRKHALACACCGLALLALGLFLCENDTGTYPGYMAVLPVAGTALLIGAGPENPLNRLLLSAKGCVFVGKISYPLYLWHWPLLSFAYILFGKQDYENAPGLRLMLVLAAFILATLTWIYVEIPIRYGKFLGKRKIVALIFGLVCVGSAGGLIYVSDGWPERLNPVNLAVYRNLKSPPRFDEDSAMEQFASKHGLEFYRYTMTGSKQTVAVIGDSHSMMLYPGLAELGREMDFNTLLLGRYPDWHFEHPNDVDWSGDNILKVLGGRNDVKDVLLSLRGAAMMYDKPNRGDRQQVNVKKEDSLKLEQNLESFIKKLLAMGKHVIIVEDNPDLETDARDAVQRRFLGLRIKDNYERTLKAEAVARQRPWLDIMARLAKIPGVTVLNGTLDSFCEGEFCEIFDKDGVPLYWDDDHLSLAGSRKLAREIIEPYFRERDKNSR